MQKWLLLGGVPPRFKGGDTLPKITKWPKSTHRNIRWDCEAGGCQIEGDTLHLRTGVNGPAHQVSIQAAGSTTHVQQSRPEPPGILRFDHLIGASQSGKRTMCAM